MSAGFYRGASLYQDSRFTDKDKKLIASREWPADFDEKLDMKKINLTVLKPWIKMRITEIIGIEDEVVVNLVQSELEEKPKICPKALTILLTGFLEKNSLKFVKELWRLLLEGQKQASGIVSFFVYIASISYRREERRFKENERRNAEKISKNRKSHFPAQEKYFQEKIIYNSEEKRDFSLFSLFPLLIARLSSIIETKIPVELSPFIPSFFSLSSIPLLFTSLKEEKGFLVNSSGREFEKSFFALARFKRFSLEKASTCWLDLLIISTNSPGALSFGDKSLRMTLK